MSRTLRLVAACLAVLCVAWWFVLGANRGWTRTTHTRIEKDPVTEIEFPIVEKRFSPGVELLAVGLVISAALAGVSLFRGSKPN